MKNYINYIKESKEDEYSNLEIENLQYEKLFLELAHLDELEIKFDFFKYKDYIFYFYNESELFDHDRKNDMFSINYNKIWSIFESNFGLIYDDILVLTKKLVDKHFKLKDITTHIIRSMPMQRVDKHFKLKDINQ